MEITPQGFETATSKLTEEQLDRPVGEVVEEQSSESAPETDIEPAPTEEQETEPEVEEDKVPKSRFLTMHQRAIEAEKALRQFEAERANQPEPVANLIDDEELKKHYVELFGEGELTDKIYQAELARMASIEEKAAERAFERLSRREQEQEQIINQRVESFDRAFEELGVIEGKDFTDDEQVAILDIIEEYSPKDADGKLIGEYLMPMDRAYEIYKLKAEPVNTAKRQARNQVASLSGARSEGNAVSQTDAEWQPGQDRRWWNKVK